MSGSFRKASALLLRWYAYSKNCFAVVLPNPVMCWYSRSEFFQNPELPRPHPGQELIFFLKLILELKFHLQWGDCAFQQPQLILSFIQFRISFSGIAFQTADATLIKLVAPSSENGMREIVFPQCRGHTILIGFIDDGQFLGRGKCPSVL